MELIKGKEVAKIIKEQVRLEVEQLKLEQNIIPGLAVIIVGEEPASKVYVESKRKACEELGIYSEVIAFSEDVTQMDILETIDELNRDPKISGILVQLPLPKHFDESEIISSIQSRKDVDGIHPLNIGKLTMGKPDFIPCTPLGVIEMLEHYNIEVEGKECVVIGKSNIVGKPIAILMLHKNATVTICHIKTKTIEAIIKRADIVVIAIGKPNFLKGYMLKQGAVVIDVGINRLDGKVVGDADFESISKVAGYATPVPGGVGPMTIAILMKNTVKAAKMNNNPYMSKGIEKL